MRQTKRRPLTVGYVLKNKFLDPLNLTAKQLSEAMDVNRNTVSRILHDRQVLTAPMAIKLGVALNTSPEFWLNIQYAVELWDIRNGKLSEHSAGVECLHDLVVSPV